MVRSIGAQIGLLAFGVAIIAGLYAGNSASTILLRALLIMVLTFLIGQLVGWTGKLALRDHLQRKKLAIDREHLAAVRAAPEPATAEERPARAEGG